MKWLYWLIGLDDLTCWQRPALPDAAFKRDAVYSARATDLADRQLAAFESRSGVPYASVNLGVIGYSSQVRDHLKPPWHHVGADREGA
ncbi:glycoside hydrolase family 47 protein [Apiospora phragmitis]|uniref:Glycoside hydrolase family 47 protein n=1 Tax=Apiospora phragmitis TaxID=2905665 RepID=A0ABR1TX55_9PEZI